LTAFGPFAEPYLLENSDVQQRETGKAALFALKFLAHHVKIVHVFCFIGDSPA